MVLLMQRPAQLAIFTKLLEEKKTRKPETKQDRKRPVATAPGSDRTHPLTLVVLTLRLRFWVFDDSRTGRIRFVWA